MRHRKTVKKLGRTSSHRKALVMNLANAFFQHERIVTTSAKASVLKRIVEKLITYGKKGNLHSMRLVFAFLRNKDTVKKLFTDIAKRYEGVNGGYVRVLKVGRRKGDNAPLSLIELTKRVEVKKEKKKK